MGSIQKRGEGKYLLTVSAGFGLNGKRQRFTRTIEAKSDKEAEKILRAFEYEIESNNLMKTDKMTFKNYAFFWLEKRKDRLGVKTHREYRRLLELRIIPAFDNMPLNKIKPHHLMSFYENLAEEGMRLDGKEGCLSSKSLRHYHNLLSTMLTHAVKWQLLSDNPAKRVEPPAIKKTEAKCLDEAEILKIIDALNDAPLKYRTAILLTIYCGLRREELAGLRWQDINIDNTISIKQAYQYIDTIGTVVTDPKTETSKRTISVPSFFQDMFRILLWEQQEDRKKLQERWTESGFVFIQSNGKPMFPDTIPKWFRKFLIRHELPLINFHGLRHSNASLLIAQKLDLVTISKRLGHSNTSTTVNIYGHLTKSVDRTATDKLENLLNKSKVSTNCQQDNKKASE